MEKEKKNKGKKIVISVATVVAVAAVAVPTGLMFAGKSNDDANANTPEQNRYTVIISSSLESVPDYTLDIDKGTNISTLKAMLKAIDGYNITGIYRNAELTETYDDADYITKDTKIFIKFEIKRFKLEICDENKQVISNKTQILDYGSEATLEQLEDRVTDLGTYKFLGWADVKTNELITEESYSVTLLDDLKVYPVYANIDYAEYRISYSFGDGNDYSSSIKVSVGGEEVNLDSTYHFGAKVKIKVTAKENNEVTEFKVKVGASKTVDALTYANRVVAADGTVSYEVEVEGNGDIAITYNEHAKQFSLGEFAENIVVKRNNKVLTSADKIYYGDELKITYSPLYEDSERELAVSGARPYGGYWIVESDVELNYTEKRNEHGITIPEGITVTRRGETLTNDSVIYYGDELIITYTEQTTRLTGGTKVELGYNYSEIETTTNVVKIGDKTLSSGSKYTVGAESVSISITPVTNLSWQQGERIEYSLGTIPEDVTVTRNGFKLSSNAIIYYGDSLVLSYIEYEDYSNFSLSVNGEALSNGASYEVTGNVEISFSADYAYSYLGFEANGSGYIVNSYDGTEANVIIPATYRGKKVTAVRDGTNDNNGVFANQPALKSVVLGENITRLGAYAFYCCTGLESAILDENLEVIGNYAFYGCSSLTEIRIPAKVREIGGDTYVGCTSVTSIVVDEANEVYTSRGSSSGTISDSNCIIEKATNTLFVGCSETVVPDTVTSIKNEAFVGCEGLERVIIDSRIVYKALDSKTAMGHLIYYAKELWLKQDIDDKTNDFICDNYTLVSAEDGYNKYTIGAEQHAYLNFNKLSNGTYEVTGMSDTSVTEVAIPTTFRNRAVTSIGRSAFNGCSNLNSVEIPESVNFIGISAFNGCSSLTSVKIPERVSQIGNAAFSGCSSLTSVTIPSRVTHIRPAVFKNCTSLTSVTIPSSVTIIDKNAFNFCDNLTSVTIESAEIYESATGIGSDIVGGLLGYATEIRVLKDIVDNNTNSYLMGSDFAAILEDGYYKFIPSSTYTYLVIENGVVTDLEDYTVTEIEIPSIYQGQKVTAIAERAFTNNSNLTSVIISDGITTIGAHAFYDCGNLQTLTIGEGVKSIGRAAFNNCYNLTTLNFNAINCDSLLEHDEYGYQTTDVFSKLGDLGSGVNVIFGDKVEKVPDGLFYTYYYDGDTDDEYPPNIISITMSPSIKVIGKYAFYRNSNITELIIGDGVEIIEESAFRHFNITNVIFPQTLKRIEDYSFGFCYNLKSISLPSNLEYIASHAFNSPETILVVGDEGNLTSKDLSGNETNCVINRETKTLILGCNNSVIPSDGSVENIGDGAFARCSFKTIVLPDTILSIGNSAFEFNRSLTSVTFSENLTHIGDSAFYSCKLTEVILPESLQFIGKRAFYNNNITSIYIPQNVSYVGSQAFDNLKLTSIVVDENNIYLTTKNLSGNETYCLINRDTKTLVMGINGAIIPTDGSFNRIEDYAFYELKTLSDVQLVEGLLSIGDYAFCRCDNITEIVIPNSVLSIGREAFYRTGLISLTIGEGVENIGEEAFAYCNSLTEINYNAIECNSLKNEYGRTKNIFINAGGSGTGIKVVFGNKVRVIPECLFFGYDYDLNDNGNDAMAYPPNIESIFFSSSIEEIGKDAFDYCDNIKTIIIEAKCIYNSAIENQWQDDLYGLFHNTSEFKVLKTIVDDPSNTNSYLNNSSNFTKTVSEDGLYYVYTSPSKTGLGDTPTDVEIISPTPTRPSSSGGGRGSGSSSSSS